MTFWVILAWVAYFAAMFLDWSAKSGSPEKTDAMFILVMACFFMLCALKERLTERAA